MPHCILQYSANVVDEVDLDALFGAVHDALVATGLFAMENIKSRAIRCEHYRVADGARDRSFVSMEIYILEGRGDAIKEQVSVDVIEVLRPFFQATFARTRCSLTVRISDMHRSSYRKVDSGD